MSDINIYMICYSKHSIKDVNTFAQRYNNSTPEECKNFVKEKNLKIKNHLQDKNFLR